MLVDFRRVLYADADADPDADAAHTRNWLTPTTFFTLNCLGNLFTQDHAPRQPPPTAANRAQPSLTRLLLSVHVCVAYNTARQQEQHSRRPPFLYVKRGSTPMRWFTHTYMRVCMCVCVRCQGHWQKAEVLLGSDFSFLFASAAMPFRVRLLCSAFCINRTFSYSYPGPSPRTVFMCFDCCWRFRDIFIHSIRVCVRLCLCAPAYQISAYIIHNGYQMTAMISILR